MPSDAERARSLLAYANYAKVAAALLVSRATVADWAKGRSVTPYRLRQLEQLLRPDLQVEKDAPPEWVERMVSEIRLNRAVLRTALEGVDPDRTRRVFRLLEDQLGPPALPLGEALGESGGATPEQPTEATQRSTSI